MRFGSTWQWLPGKRGGWIVVCVAIFAAAGTIGLWRWPEMRHLAASTLGWEEPPQGCGESGCSGHGDHADDDHDAPGHQHGGEPPRSHGDEAHEHEGDSHAETEDHKHDEAAAVKLSATARDNVGLRLEKVALRSFERTITVPAMIVERPGRSLIQVAAPMTGVITKIWPLQGETVAAGQPLFDLRLTHEEVVEAQAEFLRTTEELDVVRREIGRLESASLDGAIAGKVVLDRKYEQQKLEGVLRAQRQRLLLHGLSSEQVDQIAAKRSLLSNLTVFAPAEAEDAGTADAAGSLQVEELKVSRGQYVKAGNTLCVLADYARLYIQGKAFEQDAPVLERALADDWRVTAVVESGGQDRQTLPGLPIVYLAHKVEPDSRAFLFYVELPNKLVRVRQTPDGHRFSGWQFKPGQRLELLIPAERWADRIVLPVGAVVQDGPEAFVFEQNDGHFDRRAVRIEYRDQYSIVVANDGTLTPGKKVIVAGAYQVHLAMKNKSGGAIDPHAGHNH